MDDSSRPSPAAVEPSRTVPSQNATHTLPHRQFVERQPDRSASKIEGRAWVWATAAQALWLALAGAWVELALTFSERWFDGRISTATIRTNWYHVSFGMAAHLLVFALWWAIALGLGWAERRSRARAVRPGLAAAYLGWFLAVLSPLQTIDALHDGASLILAIGLSARVAPWWDRRGLAFARRTVIPLAIVSGLVGVGSLAWVQTSEWRAWATSPPGRTGAPNVVVLVLDTVRADHLSLYGYARDTSPRLAALAQTPGAVRFESARAAAPWTLPSHATMFTGRWPHELSVDVDRALDGTFLTLAEFLAEQGYATAGFSGNTLYCNAWLGLDRGFGRFVDAPENQTFSPQEVLRCSGLTRGLMAPGTRIGLWPTKGEYPRRKTAADVHGEALDWLDHGRPADRPFFLFLNDFDAHDPYVVPRGFPLRYSKVKRSEVMAANDRAFRALSARQTPDVTEAQREAARREVATTGLDAYDDCLRYLDDQVGRLLDALESRGLRRNTWIIITADHGEHFGEHDRFWHGSSLYRPVLDVPLLVLPPTDRAGGRREPVVVPDAVSLRNLPATVADLIGQVAASPFPGHSLRRHWDATVATSAPADDDVTLSEFRLDTARGVDPFCTAILDRDRIYHDPLNAPEELYERSDRAEATNLAPQPGAATTLQRMRLLKQRTRQSGTPTIPLATE